MPAREDPRPEPSLSFGGSSGQDLVSQGRRDPRGGSWQMWTPNDQYIHHSWIIGAAVVNAFYSPNRNQIGKPTSPL